MLDEFAAVVSECKQEKNIFADYLLFFDMSLKAGVQFDKGSYHYIGHVTMPGVDGVSIKAQAYAFGGVAEN